MVFNATFNNISVISWWRKEGYPKKTQTCHKSLTNHIMLYQVHVTMNRVWTHNLSG